MLKNSSTQTVGTADGNGEIGRPSTGHRRADMEPGTRAVTFAVVLCYDNLGQELD